MRAFLVAAFLLGACSPGTEVLVRVSATDLTVPTDVQGLRISVTDPDATDPTRVVYDSGLLALCAGGGGGSCVSLPVSVDIVPHDGDVETSVRVEVDAFATTSTPVLSQASVFKFLRGQSQTLDFDLARACLDTACATQDLACDATGTCTRLSPTGGSTPTITFDRLAFDYDAVPVGEQRTQSFTLKNDGTKSSGPIAISLDGDPGFSITSNDCEGLLLGPPCTVSVTLSPTASGSESGTLIATAAPGGASRIALSNTAGTLPSLTSSMTEADFHSSEIGVVDPTTYTWTVTNAGMASTGPLTLGVSGANPSDFTATNGCPADLAGGASCTVTITFTPSADGVRSAVVTLSSPSAAEGGSVSLAVSGTGGVLLTIDIGGTGSGTVTIEPGGIVCTTSCTHVFPTGTQLTLQARTANGTATPSFFRSWQASECPDSSFHDCSFTMTASKAVYPVFIPITSNLVFVSSVSYPATLGGALAYDAACNTLATNAGINNAASNAYIAWVSQNGNGASARLGSASGFSRLDGVPVADTTSALLGSNAIYNPISVTEDGAHLLMDTAVWTDTEPSGMSSIVDCGGWMTTSATTTPGNAFGGPGAWTGSDQTNPLSCSSTLPIYCFMHTQVATVSPSAPGGKLMWWSTGYTPTANGIADAHAFCDSKKPSSIAGSVVKALLSTTTVAASTYLDPLATYVRPDGTVIGTGANLAEGNGRLVSGPWQNELGVYATDKIAFTGSPAPNVVATSTNGDCNDWTTATSASPIAGLVNRIDAWYSNPLSTQCSSTGAAIYCVEQ